MVIDKQALFKELQKNPDRYWKVSLFKEKGFKRKQCEKCGKFFWTLTEQKICNDASCRTYDFIDNPPTKKNWITLKLGMLLKSFSSKKDINL